LLVADHVSVFVHRASTSMKRLGCSARSYSARPSAGLIMVSRLPCTTSTGEPICAMREPASKCCVISRATGSQPQRVLRTTSCVEVKRLRRSAGLVVHLLGQAHGDGATQRVAEHIAAGLRLRVCQPSPGGARVFGHQCLGRQALAAAAEAAVVDAQHRNEAPEAVRSDAFVEVSYDEAIPNNVDLGSDRQLLRALEAWHPNYLEWWKDMGPDGFQNADVYLRTAVGWTRPAGPSSAT
jgi:hypothetical protein